MRKMAKHRAFRESEGFTLIELAIVLVIIGLIVGGVVVGQSLIGAAAVRAQISQIEKYNTAVNTFKGKYGGLPGDLSSAAAAQFGFVTRSGSPGFGDGNGIIQGFSGSPYGNQIYNGETEMFWEDLSTANLIAGNFTLAGANGSSGFSNWVNYTAATTPSVGSLLPTANIGRSNYIYVYSDSGGAFCSPTANTGLNYFSLSGVNSLYAGEVNSSPGLTVAEANAVDRKVDDGMPQSGAVTATYLNNTSGDACLQWASGPNFAGPYTTATPGSTTSCFDNGNVAGATQQYSVEISNGSNVNCALSFQFQ
jgi:prepilin-type N-terminal cleavage/methylation domain-containing protein